MHDNRRQPCKTRDFHYRSIHDRDAFWREQAGRVHWETPFESVLDFSRPPFAKWFVGGKTNLCYNAVDRWLPTQAEDPALIWVSTEVDRERIYTRQDVYEEVNAAAAMLKELGVERGDRVLLYMPMVPEAVFTMLACARIGAVHSVVFGGFASVNLAQRIDDAAPKVIVCTDGGSRAGKVVPYKPLLDRALGLCKTPPAAVVVFDRGLAPFEPVAGRDLDYATLRARHQGARVPVAWLESSEPSYILYTSGTTGKPKGVQRDTGGYAVALASSMEYLFNGKPGDTYFCTSDIGWVVGHSYIIYGPLIGGQATILYEGTPVRPDGAILWKLVEKYRVNTLFSAPTAVRVLKRQDPALLKSTTCPRCAPYTWPANRWTSPPRNGSPRGWASPSSTTTGRPNRAGRSCRPSPAWKACRRVSAVPRSRCMALTPASSARPPARISVLTRRAWSPSCRPCRRARCPRSGATTSASSRPISRPSPAAWPIRPSTGAGGRGRLLVHPGPHRRRHQRGRPSPGHARDRGIRQQPRGHRRVRRGRRGRRAQGQVAMAFAVLKNPAGAETQEGARQLEGDIMRLVEDQLGAVAKPARIRFVGALPKTRSGKVLRRAIVAVCEGRDPGDLTTIEDPTALEQIKESLQ